MIWELLSKRQICSEDFAKFCGLLRLYELYQTNSIFCKLSQWWLIFLQFPGLVIFEQKMCALKTIICTVEWTVNVFSTFTNWILQYIYVLLYFGFIGNNISYVIDFKYILVSTLKDTIIQKISLFYRRFLSWNPIEWRKIYVHITCQKTEHNVLIRENKCACFFVEMCLKLGSHDLYVNQGSKKTELFYEDNRKIVVHFRKLIAI